MRAGLRNRIFYYHGLNEMKVAANLCIHSFKHQSHVYTSKQLGIDNEQPLECLGGALAHKFKGVIIRAVQNY